MHLSPKEERKEQKKRKGVPGGGVGVGWAGEQGHWRELEKKERLCGYALLPEAISK